MYKKILLFILVMFFFLPKHAFAVDFSIMNVDIIAKLQTDGHVYVEESHTYKFNGEFNGIIRTLFPKPNTSITELRAFEKDKALTVESNDFEHRIHRSGVDETITVDIFYKIENGVDVYSDVAEFFWGFFDKSNKSTYENITVTVIPPKPTQALIAFGYEEAFEKEVIKNDGSVLFNYGQVRKERNGDIRVAYEAILFPDAPIINKQMYEEIKNEQENLINAAIAKAERRELFRNIAIIILPVFAIIFIGLLIHTIVQARGVREAVKRENSLVRIVPKLTLSMPTTIFYTNYQQITSETLAAALLDLVRKGYVQNEKEHRFVLVNRQSLLEHEEILVEWLFDVVGENGVFCFDDLDAFTKEKNNHVTYQSYQTKWQEAIRKEMKAAKLYKKPGKLRMGVGLSCMTVLVPFLLLFPLNGLIVPFLITLLLAPAFLLVAIISDKTYEGEKISYEWRMFKMKFKEMSSSAWESLTEDE